MVETGRIETGAAAANLVASSIYKLVDTLSPGNNIAWGNALYFPDSSETDQGATGNNKSTKTYIDEISSNQATLVFVHRKGQSTTTYTFSTSETIPSNIKLKIEKGAILSIDNGITLTINGPFEAGLYQVFSGAGTVSIGNISVVINPKWWGADPSAASAVNAAAIQASLTAISTYGKWELPGGTFTCDSGISITTVTRASFNFIGLLRFDHCNGLLIDDSDYCKFDDIKIFSTEKDWTDVYYGLKVKNSGGNKIDINTIHSLNKAVYMQADGAGCNYNRLYIGTFQDCKYGMYVENINAGATNKTEIYGGKFSASAPRVGNYGIYFVHPDTYAYTNWTFYNTCLEGLEAGIHFDTCVYMTLVQPYFENVDNNWVECILGNEHLVWILGAADFDETKVAFTYQTRDWTIIGAGGNDTNYKTIITSADYGGLSFASETDLSGSIDHLRYVKAGSYGLLWNDRFGQGSVFGIKGYYTTNGAAPVAGTYMKGAVCWNHQTIASGNVIAWTADSAGTEGTLAGVTGTVANGSPLLTVNSVTDLVEGQYLDVAGDGGGTSFSGIQIKYINRATKVCTMYSNATKASTGTAVSYHSVDNWVSQGNYP